MRSGAGSALSLKAGLVIPSPASHYAIPVPLPQLVGCEAPGSVPSPGAGCRCAVRAPAEL